MKISGNLIRFVYFALRYPQLEPAMRQHKIIYTETFHIPSTHLA